MTWVAAEVRIRRVADPEGVHRVAPDCCIAADAGRCRPSLIQINQVDQSILALKYQNPLRSPNQVAVPSLAPARATSVPSVPRGGRRG
jgi:hypothetical protein